MLSRKVNSGVDIRNYKCMLSNSWRICLDDERTAFVWAWSVRFKYLNFITCVLPIDQLLIFTQMNLKVRLVFNCNDLPLKFCLWSFALRLLWLDIYEPRSSAASFRVKSF